MQQIQKATAKCRMTGNRVPCHFLSKQGTRNRPLPHHEHYIIFLSINHQDVIVNIVYLLHKVYRKLRRAHEETSKVCCSFACWSDERQYASEERNNQIV